MSDDDSYLQPVDDVTIWLDNGVAMLKCVQPYRPYGNPVELNEDELRAVIGALQRTLDRMLAEDAG